MMSDFEYHQNRHECDNDDTTYKADCLKTSSPGLLALSLAHKNNE